MVGTRDSITSSRTGQSITFARFCPGKPVSQGSASSRTWLPEVGIVCKLVRGCPPPVTSKRNANQDAIGHGNGNQEALGEDRVPANSD